MSHKANTTLLVSQSINNNKNNLCDKFEKKQPISSKIKVLTSSSMTLIDKIKENLLEQSIFLNNPTTSIKRTIKSLSTSSLTTNGRHLSRSFCGDCRYSCSTQCVAQLKNLSSNFNLLPYHTRTVSCSVGCSDSAYNSEKAVANAVLFHIQKRNAIAEESSVLKILPKDNTSSSTNEACCSLNGSASFLAVPCKFFY